MLRVYLNGVDQSAGAGTPDTRTIATTAPLTGGGNLQANRTLSINDFTGDAGAGGTKGTVPAPAIGDATKLLAGDAVFHDPLDGIIPNMTGDAGSGGTHGLVPAPGIGDATKFLRGDASYADPSSVAPADTVSDETTYGTTPNAGAATEYSRGDHTHGSPATPVTSLVGADSAIQPSSSTGNISLAISDMGIDVGSGVTHGLVPANPTNSAKLFLSSNSNPPWVQLGDVTNGSSSGFMWQRRHISLAELQALGAISSHNFSTSLGSPPGATIFNFAVLSVVTPLQGGSVSAATASVGTNAATFNDLLLSGDIFTAATAYGTQDGDLGTGLARATAVQGGLVTVSPGVGLTIKVDLTGDTFDHLTQGDLVLYVGALMIVDP